MSNNRYPVLVFFFVVIFSIIIPIFYYSHLPATVASHFNFDNKADSWMNKKSFLMFQIALTVFLSGMFFSFAYFIPNMPKSIINLPQKDYWLSDERKEESFAVIQQYMYWFGSITIIFMVAVFQLVYLANVTGQQNMNPVIWIYLVLYLTGTSVFTIRLIKHFKRPLN